MNDDTDEELRESDANVRERWLPADEAAQILGVSIRTVQKRAESGKLASRTEGRRLFVALPEEPLRDDRRESSEPIRESDANVREDQQALIDHLQGEVAFLRAQIEQRDVAEAEQRRLTLAAMNEANLLRQQLALTAAPIEDGPQSPQDALREAHGAKQGQTPAPFAKGWWKRLMKAWRPEHGGKGRDYP